MTCRSVLEHEDGPRVLVSAYTHPREGRTLVYEVRCARCGRVRRETERPGQVGPAYAHVTREAQP